MSATRPRRARKPTTFSRCGFAPARAPDMRTRFGPIGSNSTVEKSSTASGVM
jgi:hypothetical protein